MKRMMGLILVTLFAITACERDGPAERFGEDVDQAAGNIENAARDAADRLEDVATDAGNAIEDACEEATDRNC